MTLFDLIRLEDELSVLIGSKVEIALKNKLKPVIGKYILKEVIYI
jgi:predicted nucleotidyltransferase